jgi:hypothetical protein
LEKRLKVEGKREKYSTINEKSLAETLKIQHTEKILKIFSPLN